DVGTGAEDAGTGAEDWPADRNRYTERNGRYRTDAGMGAEDETADRSRYAERGGQYRRSTGTKSRESGAGRKKYSLIDSIRNRRTASRQGKRTEWTLGSRLREEWKQFTAYVNESWRVRLLLILCAFLLIGMVTKYTTDRIFYREMDITDAFVVTDSGCLESRMQITVDYGTAFLTEHDKQALIGYLANSLGIRMEGAADYQENEVSQVYTYHKEAKRAATTIKAITLRQDTSRTYLYTELVIQNDVNFDILSYRDILLEALKDLQVVQSETTMQFLGAYEGELPLERWDRIANSMIKELGGKIIYENRDKELYTIYAYSSQLPEYVSVDQKKINIQVAMRYEEDNNRTVVYLATPLLRGDW
ncbi:MAG: YwmB family TATA-box binding protein, partial [Lachnospiraceae bacterium]|nr:YwmB family TATA-box binding protein [Lachnospiraceae bacterium]